MKAAVVVLHVFAAASLTDAFRELAAVYEKAHPGVTVEMSFAGSQVLRTQMEHGAPADVFASADMIDAEALAGAGLLSSVQVFATNTLVLIAPAGPARVGRLEDLEKPGIKVVVAGATVPAGRYTARVLGRLAGRLGGEFKARVEANVVSQETSVRAVLAKVALGEADAGFVYATDAATSPRVRAIALPDADNVVAEYPIGIVTRSAVRELARAFVELVLGSEGQATLRKHGFATRR